MMPRLHFSLLALSAFSVPAATAAEPSFRELRSKHTTTLLTRPAPEVPPKDVFELVHYPAKPGKLAAYLSPAPRGEGKHPLIIWLVGGFSNSVSSVSWEKADPANNQSADAYRKAGIPMMFPSLRGGNNNPGEREGLFGEVDDVIAAATYAASLPWVDSSRIYLGGHSTGGTLALLVAGNSDLFRGVISFGPVHSTVAYGQDALPFDIENKTEMMVRAPVLFLPEIRCPVIVLEGQHGNAQAVEVLKKYSRNSLVSFHLVEGVDHFNILAPFNELLASKILADKGPKSGLALSAEEIRTAAAKAVPRKKNGE